MTSGAPHTLLPILYGTVLKWPIIHFGTDGSDGAGGTNALDRCSSSPKVSCSLHPCLPDTVVSIMMSVWLVGGDYSNI